MRFEGKVAIVTGGGTGIGKATAIGFAKEGAKVVICGRREEQLKQALEEIKKINEDAIYIKADISKASDMENVVKKCVDTYGKLDIMVNNAGVNLAKDLIETTEEDVDRIVNINIKGTFFGMREAIKQMLKQKSAGSIINISSMSGLMGHPTRTVYCGSKAAIINMTRAAAMEFAEKDIRINVICPGVIDTPMAQEHMEKAPEVVRGYIQSIPMKRMGTSEEIASIILFLASDDASYVTGAVIAVDGGFAAGKN